MKVGTEQLRDKVDVALQKASHRNYFEPLGYKNIDDMPCENAGFMPNVSGDEPHKLVEQLRKIGFGNLAWNAPYHWHMIHSEEQVVAEYVEGDLYLITLEDYKNYKKK